MSMRFSLRWLKQMLNFDLSVEQIVDTMMMAGLEVEEEVDLGLRSGKIVVARVEEVERHPNAEKLSVCKVDAGQGELLSIVCGAPNVAAGMLVPCALEGATLPNGLTIERRKLRGVESRGMLCAADELGLGTDHTGIMALPDDSVVGEPFDAIVEIKVTPNRPDCLSVLGAARDVAAMHGRKVYPPKPRVKEMLTRIENFAKLTVRDRKACPRYTCRVIKGVKVGPSPLWMKQRLEASGLRAINNVVDVTNYVLLELGHPLHAFDADKLAGSEIVVRMAEAGEKLKIIDGSELTLTADDLLIADASRGVALAGVMGGFDSEVTHATTNVLLEAAYFDPATIRRTSKRHGISTDASYRFERGTDREQLTLALNRAAQLIQEVAGGEVAKGLLDVVGAVEERQPIVLELERVNRLLGLELNGMQIADYLVNLGFEIRSSGAGTLVVEVPSHRVDVARDVDLIEEVARMHNYNNIPRTMPRVLVQNVPRDAMEQLVEATRDCLVTQGLAEAMSYGFISEAQAAAVGVDPATQPRVANPISVEQVIMRPSVLPGVLEAVRLNQSNDEPSIALFEVGKAWKAGAQAGDPDGEQWEVALALAGPAPGHWSRPGRTYDFYDVKGVIEGLAEGWAPEAESRLEPLRDSSLFHPGRSARMFVGETPLADFGEAHPDLARRFDLRGEVYLARVDLTAVAGHACARVAKMKPIPRFPGSWRDVAVVVGRETAVGAMVEAAGRAGGELVETVELFDIYEGEHMAEGKKSVALRMRLRAPEKTLTEEEIRGTVERITKALEKQFGAVLRT